MSDLILTESFVSKYKNKQPNWGFNGLGYIVYKRTYARLKDNGKTEEWYETVQRCIEGAQKIGAQYTPEEAERIYDYVFNLKCNFAGRMLWQLGTSTVDRFGANSLLNCWATAMREPKAFLFLFENLMLGGGVGYSIRREDVHELPKIKKSVDVIHEATKDADYIVPDKREGWVNLLSKVLDAFYVTGKSFTYSTILIRGYGESIKGFGGKASGPQILIDGISKITKIFQARENKKLRSIDVLDICNIIGSVVVAGNVRRSAEIALGDPDDILYLRAKNWGSGNVPNWRAMSNNTIYADSYDHVLEEIWKNGYEINKDSGYANGEPYGFFNLPLSQKFGRIKDGPISDNSMYPTDTDNCEMTNPCAEISLSNYECCNLSELYLNNITSKEELIDCSKLLYKTQKAIAALPFIHEETNRIVHKNMRLGLGVTGVCQSLHKLDWLDDCYVALRAFDRDWSKQRGWPESIKLTTIKPSGTLSLLGGATPGVHPAFSQYYMRTVRMSSSDALVQTCKDMGYHVEFLVNFDGTENRDTVVVYFPCKTPEGSILTKDMDVLKQLDMVKKLQTVWSDNAVSVTAYYKPEELDSLKTWLKDNYEHNVKSVSFLLFKDHGFKQAPYQEIDEAAYLAASSKVKPLSSMTINSNEMLDMAECSSGACPIR
jgi:ribonucleoside-triphosphate reductase